jgi:hypothetical protein
MRQTMASSSGRCRPPRQTARKALVRAHCLTQNVTGQRLADDWDGATRFGGLYGGKETRSAGVEASI